MARRARCIVPLIVCAGLCHLDRLWLHFGTGLFLFALTTVLYHCGRLNPERFIAMASLILPSVALIAAYLFWILTTPIDANSLPLHPSWHTNSLAHWVARLHQSQGVSKARVCILGYENRESAGAKALQRVNQDYCERHGYDCRFVTTPVSTIPPWWIKVKLVRDVLEEGTFDWIVWLDSDACVHNHDWRIEPLAVDGALMYISSDRHSGPRQWHKLWSPVDSSYRLPLDPSHFNAGVWILNGNHSLSRRFLSDWWANLNMKQWRMEGNEWVTEGGFAGPNYEQGSGWALMTLPLYASHIQFLPWRIIQARRPEPPTWMLHFYGERESIIPYVHHRYKSAIEGVARAAVVIQQCLSCFLSRVTQRPQVRRLTTDVQHE